MCAKGNVKVTRVVISLRQERGFRILLLAFGFLFSFLLGSLFFFQYMVSVTVIIIVTGGERTQTLTDARKERSKGTVTPLTTHISFPALQISSFCHGKESSFSTGFDSRSFLFNRLLFSLFHWSEERKASKAFGSCTRLSFSLLSKSAV